MNKKELIKRIIVSVLGIPLVIFVTVYSEWSFFILINVILTLGIFEFYQLFVAKGFQPIFWIGIVFVNILSFLLFNLQYSIFVVGLLFAIILILIYELFRNKPNPIINISVTLFGIFYILLFATFVVLRKNPWFPGISAPEKGWLIVWIFSMIWICDTGAYFVGSLFGKHPLCLRVSPKKSWEGSIGGFTFALFASVLLGEWFVPFLPIKERILIGIIVGVFGQISDLVESLLKRDSGVKDSGRILPGHGGVMDRFDSPLLIAPLVCIYFVCRYYFF